MCNDNSLTNWDAWDGLSSVVSDGNQHTNQRGPKLTPLQQQIQEYRLNQQKKLSEPQDSPEEPNYFEVIWGFQCLDLFPQWRMAF